MNTYASVNKKTGEVIYVMQTQATLEDENLIKVTAMYTDTIKDELISNPYNKLLLVDGVFVVREDTSSVIPVFAI